MYKRHYNNHKVKWIEKAKKKRGGRKLAATLRVFPLVGSNDRTGGTVGVLVGLKVGFRDGDGGDKGGEGGWEEGWEFGEEEGRRGVRVYSSQMCVFDNNLCLTSLMPSLIQVNKIQ